MEHNVEPSIPVSTCGMPKLTRLDVIRHACNCDSVVLHIPPVGAQSDQQECMQFGAAAVCLSMQIMCFH